jgi:hypothetical protein
MMQFNNTTIHKASWYLRRYADRLGIVGITGVVILIASLIFCVAVILPLKKEVYDAGNNLARLSDKSPALSIEQMNKLGEFYGFFPKADAMTDSLNKIYHIAGTQNLGLEQGDYHLIKDPNNKLTRYEINLPVKGGYLQIRQFLAKTLKEIPNLSLDNVNFKRQKIHDAAIESQIKFTLYLGDS